MIKVLYILHSTVMGGATISFLNLVRGIRKKGLSVIVLIPKHDEEFEKSISEIGGRCYAIPIVVSAYPSLGGKTIIHYFNYVKSFLFLLLRKINSYRKICKIVSIEHPSIIHTNVGVVHEGFICAKRRKIPHVWHLREYQDKDFNISIFPSKKGFIKLLKKTYVITITDDIRSHYNLLEYKKARTIYNGILPASSCRCIFPKKNMFLCASRISKEKGHEEVIRVFAKFRKNFPDYRLVILGFGEEEYIRFLKSVSEELGCSESIDWMGYTEDVLSYMETTKALIVNSRFEGFGRMTAEACFCGSLVVGRNTGGTKEILDYTGGYSYSTETDMLQSLNMVAQLNEADYKSMIKKSQKKAVTLYSNESNIDNTYDFYLHIIKEGVK